MKRLALAFFPVALAAALLGPMTGEAGGEVERCEGFTAERMLQHPAFAEHFQQALEENEAAARAHLDALVSQLKEAHGCGASGATGSPHGPAHPSARPAAPLPPGHPPIDGVPGAIPAAPLFRDPETVTI